MVNNSGFFKIEKIRIMCFIVLCFFSMTAIAQDSLKLKKEAIQYLNDAEDALAENDFPQAEASFRKAVAKDPTNAAARYNFGNLYYTKKKSVEAEQKFKEAARIAVSKSEKHKAYHNLGNTFMNQKKYAEAIEAYKNALRNNPEDDETRYNLAYAKQMWEEKQQQSKSDEGKDQEDKKDGKEDKNEGEGGDDQQKKNQQKKEKGEGENNENKDGEEKKDDQGQPKQPKENNKEGEPKDQSPQQPKPSPGQLSPERVKSLLEAMDNEERKVMEKINAQKAKGQPTKTEKDW
ncbi:MAG TPA: tetratricopeptide repeat protein [Salinimicrobium sp.]|nr:tetratricopeptide repeat protein [Salinimicrobium sp.]